MFVKKYTAITVCFGIIFFALILISRLKPDAKIASLKPAPTQQQQAIHNTPEAQKKLDVQLIAAAGEGNFSEVQRLLKVGADINLQDNRGRTPVMVATHARNAEMVYLLIQNGADINIQDNMKDNPFLYAGAEGLLDILKLTIDAKPDTKLTNRFGGTALIPAADRGHVKIVKEIITKTDVDINHVNNLGWTALLEAIILGEGGSSHTEIVQLLVEAGADVNITDKNGVTPLMHARQRGYLEIINILEGAEVQE